MRSSAAAQERSPPFARGTVPISHCAGDSPHFTKPIFSKNEVAKSGHSIRAEVWEKNHDTKNRPFVLCEERIHVYFTEISGTAHGHDHVAVSVEHHDRLPGGIRFRRAPLTGKIMAEGGGFEPPVDLRLHNLSKVAPSTTRTPLQSIGFKFSRSFGSPSLPSAVGEAA